LGEVLGATLCFCLAASSIYILNDLVDIDADRAHPTKHTRPLAAGTISVLDALLAAPLLLAASLIAAFFLNPWFAAVLVCYIALTTAYTLLLKRKMMVDVIALAALYTIRVIGGAVVIATPVSEWLLAFSMFMFTALALIKRYVELATLTDADLPNPTNRNYQKSDLHIVAILAMAAAFNAITVFALYISSDAVKELYRHPQVLWFICPILMYWLGRIMMLAHRRLMNDDPVLFALKDWNSLVAAALIGAAILAGM
jgi:4-hydroxybenzoate polyprenyltransferase